MHKTKHLSVVAIVLLVCAGILAAPTTDEQNKLDALAAEIDGAVIYTQGGTVYKWIIGTAWDAAIDLGTGNYARWSPDGTRIAVVHLGDLYVMDADGSNRTQLLSGLTWNINPIEYSADGTEILFTQSNYGLRAVDIAGTSYPTTIVLRDVATYHKYFGEPTVSLSGTRVTARQDHDLYAIDVGVGDHKYAVGCSPGVSPCGAYVMNNTGNHDLVGIRDWDGSNVSQIDSSTCQPDGLWDNQHWSNHPDYAAVQGDVVGEVYVMKISAGECTRITWVENCRYPDLWVDNILTISGNVVEAGTSNPVANRIIRADDGVDTIETQTDDNGDYMIVGVLDGSYTLSMPGGVLSPVGSGSNPVTVSGADVTANDYELTLDDNEPDGLDDAWEYKFFGDTTTTDGTGDYDGDGLTDAEEYAAGTNPTIAEGGNGGGGCGPVGVPGIGLIALLAAARLLRRRR